MSQTDAPPSATPFYPGPYTMQPAYHGTCPDCGRVAFLPHDCPPWYTVQLDGYADNETIRAISAEEAAELATEIFDFSGEVIAGRDKLKVSVTDEAGRVTWWKVRGEMVPEYIAQEVEP